MPEGARKPPVGQACVSAGHVDHGQRRRCSRQHVAASRAGQAGGQHAKALCGAHRPLWETRASSARAAQ